jgi:hypothetical protein
MPNRNDPFEGRFAEMHTAAADHHTPPEQLRGIYNAIQKTLPRFGRHGALEKSRHGILLAALAANPNIPPELIFADFPPPRPLPLITFLDAFLSNPIAPLLPLEHPEIVEQMLPLLPALLARASVPGIFVRIGLNSTTIGTRDAAENHILHAGELDPHSETCDILVREWLLQQPVSDTERDLIFEAVVYHKALAWLSDALRKHDSLPSWETELLSEPMARRYQRAADPQTSLSTLHTLLAANTPRMRLSLYQNPALSPAFQASIRSAAAQELAVEVEKKRRPERRGLLDWLYLSRRDMKHLTVSELEEWLTAPLDRPRVHRLSLAMNPTAPRTIIALLAEREGHRLIRAMARRSQESLPEAETR